MKMLHKKLLENIHANFVSLSVLDHCRGFLPKICFVFVSVGDPYLWLMDPDPDPTPDLTPFFSNFEDARKNFF
jgi:hypothetical protein